jgi:unsaturated chondroitin disaccharide hydrolase
MKLKNLPILICTCISLGACQPQPWDEVGSSLSYCHHQVERTLSELKSRESGIDYTLMPRNIADTANVWHLRKATKEEWCAGFWPGVLWYDYEYTGNPAIREEAEQFTASLEFLAHTPAYDHDLGFLIFCSYGNGYRLTGNPAYKQVILDTADTLATLFNPTVGALLSWPRHVEDYGGHNVIMDNMMNLEMLFWAAKNGGGQHLYDIAVSHADKTMNHHFRPDYTSYHVAVYDTLTGGRINALTHQGYADESQWARGQAWAIYGFTVAYRETKDEKYLDFVQKVTDAYLARLPEEGIPYWDFDDPRIPDAPRDASAACVVASALAELHAYVPTEKGTHYKEAALKMLQSLGSEVYRAGEAKPSFLLHSTGNLPAGSEIDASIIYADYYYIEALLRWMNILKNNQ